MLQRLIITAALATLLSGCASIISDKNYPVAINSQPPGAHFTVVNQAGVTVSSGTTPQTVTLPSSAGFFDGETYVVHFTEDGYDPVQSTVDSSVDGWYFANLLFGGLVGLFIVDPATGAMWKLPETTNVTLGVHTATK